jgi:hypothetical protein
MRILSDTQIERLGEGDVGKEVGGERQKVQKTKY